MGNFEALIQSVRPENPIILLMTDFDSITTRGGDTGQTSIADGSRRPKDDLLIEMLGEVDELHAALGMLKAALPDLSRRDEIDWVEHCLLRIGGMLAVPPSHEYWSKLNRVDDGDIGKLESWQKEVMDRLKLPTVFITYGDSETGARADMARAICRRTERHIVRLIRERAMTELAPAQRFLNRLSDYLFVLAREMDKLNSEL